MTMDEWRQQVRDIRAEIQTLPRGNITWKTIRGAERMYLQWREDNRLKSRYIRKSEQADIVEKVSRRKELEQQLGILLRHSSERELTEFRYDGTAAIDQKDLSRVGFFGRTVAEGKDLSEIRYRETNTVERGDWSRAGYSGTTAAERKAAYGTGGFSFSQGSDAERGKDIGTFQTNVVTGDGLLRMTGRVAGMEQRECMEGLHRYLHAELNGRVCLIYGLRRTGKTTMILQAINELPVGETAYLKMMNSNTMAQLNHDLHVLAGSGYHYIFVDEVTLLKDFIDSASLLSDVYAMQGMKIVLSGTDSLGFALSGDGELYDRTVTIHTTFIAFREYVRLLQIRDIDAYIRYGGTLRAGETNFGDPALLDDSLAFRDDESARRYVDTAIARNIQHSLACYDGGGHFRHLRELYDRGELTGAINRIVEDMNHRFLVSVLTGDFVSHDLGSAAQILRKRAAGQGEIGILDQMDTSAVTDALMKMLEIQNRADQSVMITEDHAREIREYLEMLDLTVRCPVETIGAGAPVYRTLFAQPGLRYVQAEALVYALMKDNSFLQYPAAERKKVTDLILEEVRGRMLEEIVLLETIKAAPRGTRVFQLQFAVGEFDMVIASPDMPSCRIFEIKHTENVTAAQYRHLIDEEKCRQTEYAFGPIESKTVLYRGDDQTVDGIEYRNVEEYLCGII